MPERKILEISREQQAQILRELRCCRHGYFLSLHILLLYASGKSPTAIAEYLFCSRSSVYRAIDDWNGGKLIAQWWPEPQANQPEPAPTQLQRRLLRLITQSPRLFGWWRVRWSCTALALTIAMQTGLRVSRETIRLELRAAGYVWKRAKLSARNDDPQRALRLAQIRSVIEHLQGGLFLVR